MPRLPQFAARSTHLAIAVAFYYFSISTGVSISFLIINSLSTVY